MFHVGEASDGRRFRLAMAAAALLSLLALAVSIWILADFRNEQRMLAGLMRHLPAGDVAAAKQLASELRMQARLTLLLFLNGIATAAALAVLARAYLTSERSLRDVKVLAADVLASMDQAVITTDQNARLLSINPSGEALLGSSKNNFGVALADLSAEHRTLAEICRLVLDHHDSVRDRDYVATHNGHTRTFRAGCSLLQNDRGERLGTVIHVRDVTEKTLMEQRLRRMERYMGLGSVAAGLHHEIKNPLSALSLHVQLLDEALPADGVASEVRDMLGVLKTEVSRITDVLEGFRDFASISELRRCEVHLPKLVTKLVSLIAPQAKQQGVRLETDLPDEGFPGLIADGLRLEQVLLNLIVNALEAMPEGGVLSIRLAATADVATIEIADSGGGIPDDLRDRVFDPYFTTRSNGTGMGLALSEKIIRQHNGAIDFQSSAEGTVFTVSLPRNESP